MRSSSTAALVDVLVAPDAAFAALQARPRFGLPLAVLGTAAAAILMAQGMLLEPALRHDPLVADLPAGTGRILLWLRALLAVVAPAGIAIRALAFGALLHALQAGLGGRASRPSAVALVLHLETVFLLESAALLLLLALARPIGLEEIHALRLRAGLDLVWQPRRAGLAAACTAANAFALWWGLLLLRGIGRLARLSRRRAALAAAPPWLLTVLLRFLLQPR
jgi:hypothetical protein